MILSIDESGSMTVKHSKDFPFFVISIIKTIDTDKIKKKIKRYISKNMVKLRILPKSNKMFLNGKFHELKGAALDYVTRKEIAEMLMDEKLFEIYYIIVDNSNVNEKLYDNTARAFNYLLGLNILHNYKKGAFTDRELIINIDERNVRTDSKNGLEDYIAIKLGIENDFIDSVKTTYYDSSTNLMIQLADFYANLYYSFLFQPKNYESIIQEYRKKDIIKDVFLFPL